MKQTGNAVETTASRPELEPHDALGCRCVSGTGAVTRAECHATPRNTRHIKIKIITIDCVEGGGWRCETMYVQYGELARLQRQDWEQEEADHEAGQGAEIAGSEDEESVPSAHCRPVMISWSGWTIHPS